MTESTDKLGRLESPVDLILGKTAGFTVDLVLKRGRQPEGNRAQRLGTLQMPQELQDIDANSVRSGLPWPTIAAQRAAMRRTEEIHPWLEVSSAGQAAGELGTVAKCVKQM